jgi:hypothetical protein
MSTTTYRYYELKTFELGQLSSCFSEILESLKLSEKNFHIRGTFSPGDNIRESRYLTLKQVSSVCELKDNPSSLSFSFTSSPEEKYNKENSLILSPYRGVIQAIIEINNPDITKIIISSIEGRLKLQKTELPNLEVCQFKEILQRLELLENKINAKSDELSCFLSYRFSNSSKNIALELTRFLELLGIKVISGVGYEPRKIEEKVMSRLNQPLDFLIYLITKEGESMWTRDELMLALSKGYALVLLVESGADINSGLLGNWEYIEFEKNHIGDTFIGILEALRYIRGEKYSVLNQSDKNR